MISEHLVELYRSEGYLAIDSILSDSELAPARAAISRLIDEAKAQDIQQSTELYELELAADHSNGPVVKRLQYVWKYDQPFRDLASNEKILDCVEPLLGSNVELHHTKAYLKPSVSGTKVGLHQDYAFFPHTNDDVLAVMVYFNDGTVENGCLHVVPGSHLEEPLPHVDAEGNFQGRVSENAVAEQMERAVPLEVAAGGITIHHYKTVHFSPPNHTPIPRWAVNVQFRASDAVDLAAATMGSAPHDECVGVVVRGHRLFEARFNSGEVVALPNVDASPTAMPRVSDLTE
jgi:ectoine hydroxylase-related dioxygenase (phytanoyl-CoA dioxygenase family)